MEQLKVHRYGWRLSNIISLILLIILSIIWQNAYHQQNNPNDIPLKNNTEVMQYLQYTWLNKYTLKPPVLVPTGIYINDITFKSLSELNVVFYIWQRYPTHIPKFIDPIFYITEQTDFINQLVLFEEKYSDEEIKGSYIETRIHQQFNYLKYPFDNQILYLSIWPKYYTENIILIPDFASYESPQSGSFIGIYPNLRLRGFIIEGSYFGYTPSNYKTNFGYHDSIDKYGYPYFYYALILKRAFFTAFIWHILPLIIAYILLFISLMMNTKNKYKLTKFQFIGTLAINNIGALFFVLIVIHVGLRTTLYSNQIIYLEYFYFLIYFLMALLGFNNYLLLQSEPRKIKFIHYADNLLPKILFWPVVLMFALIISIKILI